MVRIEYVLWGTSANKPDWAEDIIAVRHNRIDLVPAINWAESKGFRNLRVVESDLYEAPDFVKCLNIN